LQFENPDDLENYPRNVKGDTEKALASGATQVWVPRYEELYPGAIEK